MATITVAELIKELQASEYMDSPVFVWDDGERRFINSVDDLGDCVDLNLDVN